jgi:hypothetical protein
MKKWRRQFLWWALKEYRQTDCIIERIRWENVGLVKQMFLISRKDRNRIIVEEDYHYNK